MSGKKTHKAELEKLRREVIEFRNEIGNEKKLQKWRLSEKEYKGKTDDASEK